MARTSKVNEDINTTQKANEDINNIEKVNEDINNIENTVEDVNTTENIKMTKAKFIKNIKINGVVYSIGDITEIDDLSLSILQEINAISVICNE